MAESAEHSTSPTHSGDSLALVDASPPTEHSLSDSVSGASGDTEGPDAPSRSASSSETEGPDSDRADPDALDSAEEQSVVSAGAENCDFVASRSMSENTGIKELSVPNVTSFVALDLQEKVKQSGQRRQTLLRSPTDLPPIDPKSLNDIEDSARKLSEDVDKMLEGLKKTLHTMSAISVGCMQVYRGCVEKTCDEVDTNVKTMYAYMAKVEEVGQSFKPVVDLSNQLNDIKRVLDRLERQAGIIPPL